LTKTASVDVDGAVDVSATMVVDSVGAASARRLDSSTGSTKVALTSTAPSRSTTTSTVVIISGASHRGAGG